VLQDAETGQGDALHDYRLLHLHAQQEQPHHCNSTTQYVWMKTQTVCVYENTDYMFVWKYKPCVFKNKRAKRALGRSPEEKVKGHSESSGPCSFRQEDF